MQKVITISALVFFMAVTGCKKEDTKPGTTNRVKTRYVNSENNTYNYIYDEQGRVTSYSLDDGYVEFTYTGNEVKQTFYNSSNAKTAIKTFTLDNAGLAEKVVQIHNGQNTTELYTYSNGLRVEIKRYLNGGLDVVYNTVYENGNMVSAISRSQPFNEIVAQIYYDYYTDKLTTIGNENMGFGFVGKGSKNLVNHIVYLSSLGDTIYVYSNKYQFDDAGRVKAEVKYDDQTGVLEDSITYTYY